MRNAKNVVASKNGALPPTHKGEAPAIKSEKERGVQEERGGGRAEEGQTDKASIFIVRMRMSRKITAEQSRWKDGRTDRHEKRRMWKKRKSQDAKTGFVSAARFALFFPISVEPLVLLAKRIGGKMRQKRVSLSFD